jgi:hypothetical protein
VNAIPAGDECRNPLFEIHWFTGREGDTQTLSGFPEVRTNLRLCPAHNNILSCCREAFEGEQLLHFNFWRQILSYKVERLTKNKAAVAKVQKSDIFNTATNAERSHFLRVLSKLDEVIDPSVHAGCFSALVTYMAGMICFACLPNWRSIVHEDYGKIVRILLTTGTCTEVWARCEEFGHKAKMLHQVMLDSKLAIMQSTSFENFEMFHDQQALCDWMHDAVAMHPFTTPSEMEREAVPVPNVIRTLLAESPNSTSALRRLQLPGKQEYDAMKGGKASGFDITWAGDLSSGATARWASCWNVMLLLSGLLHAAAGS